MVVYYTARPLEYVRTYVCMHEDLAQRIIRELRWVRRGGRVGLSILAYNIVVFVSVHVEEVR
jgi:hypothetical protein